MSMLIKNATIVNEGEIYNSDVLIKDGFISKIDRNISLKEKVIEVDAQGLHLFPGVIDDQVHFREPGLTHKGDIHSESRAAVAGGVTSFMEQPNTNPPATSVEELEKKYLRASQCSVANYSFLLGTTNDNINELQKADYSKIAGVKIFMGSSTGNMLVDNIQTLENIFQNVNALLVTHCEDDPMIKLKHAEIIEKYGEDIPAYFHSVIRSEEACHKSSSLAVSLAKKFNARLHVFHISTAKELSLFTNKIPLKDKLITAEACIHHLWFNDEDYQTKGNFIKWNPSVKTEMDRAKLFEAVLNDTIDVVATDHAPHTVEEKSQSYLKAPSGGPLIQHSLLAMLDFYHMKKISLTHIAKKMCHDPAVLFRIQNRGFIREGYAADLTLVDLNKNTSVTKDNILYKCKWSPFEGHTFKSSIHATFVNGHPAWFNNKINDQFIGQRLLFNSK
ncbi:MAG: dihydroorotase [Sphingobacteriaceae bacterium]|nr:dihydroorotase [Sphingobacteriaceae bacterium]